MEKPLKEQDYFLDIIISIAIGFALILFITGCTKHEMPIKKAPSTKAVTTNAELKTPPFLTKPGENVDSVQGFWILAKSVSVNLDNNFYTILGITRTGSESNYTKIVVEKYDKQLKQWLNVWEGPEIDQATYVTDDSIDLVSIRSASKKKAIIIANVVVGNKDQLAQVIELDSKGNAELLESEDCGLAIVEKNDQNTITIDGQGSYGIHKVYFKNEEAEIEVVSRSDKSAANAVKAYFMLVYLGNSYGVVASKNNSLTLNVGQSIVFVPSNEATKKPFNDGEISIYTDAWNGNSSGDLSEIICSACEIKSGSSYKFESTGVFHFVLDYFSPDENSFSNYQSDSQIKPTFTVVVK